MGRKKVDCQCDPPCVSAAACRQKRSRVAHRAAAIALAVGAVGAAVVGAGAVVAAAAALAAGSKLQTPVKRPAPPTQMAPPRKATKRGLAFHSEILTGLRDLSAMMRKSNILAEQVDALMQQENEKSVSWQGKVVQQWAAPCPLSEASPQTPLAQAPSLSVTRKVVLTVTVTVNKNPGAQ